MHAGEAVLSRLLPSVAIVVREDRVADLRIARARLETEVSREIHAPGSERNCVLRIRRRDVLPSRIARPRIASHVGDERGSAGNTRHVEEVLAVHVGRHVVAVAGKSAARGRLDHHLDTDEAGLARLLGAVAVQVEEDGVPRHRRERVAEITSGDVRPDIGVRSTHLGRFLVREDGRGDHRGRAVEAEAEVRETVRSAGVRERRALRRRAVERAAQRELDAGYLPRVGRVAVRVDSEPGPRDRWRHQAGSSRAP